MKLFTTGLLFLTMSHGIFASEPFEFKSKTLSTQSIELEVELNSETVLCSDADYGAKFLKILIPQLSELTFLDHRNSGAGAPCVGAGMCGNDWHDGPVPSDILDTAKPTEQITVKIELERNFAINHITQDCSVTLIEKITTSVRGIDFFHILQAQLGKRNYEDCLK